MFYKQTFKCEITGKLAIKTKIEELSSFIVLFVF